MLLPRQQQESTAIMTAVWCGNKRPQALRETQQPIVTIMLASRLVPAKCCPSQAQTDHVTLAWILQSLSRCSDAVAPPGLLQLLCSPHLIAYTQPVFAGRTTFTHKGVWSIISNTEISDPRGKQSRSIRQRERRRRKTMSKYMKNKNAK